jgi:hypothetical protein
LEQYAKTCPAEENVDTMPIGFGGMMPGMPGLDTYNWEVPRSQSMSRINFNFENKLDLPYFLRIF